MIVLDTTVLVYAQGAEHPLHAPYRALVTIDELYPERPDRG